jgi:hypothetical protein
MTYMTSQMKVAARKVEQQEYPIGAGERVKWKFAIDRFDFKLRGWFRPHEPMEPMEEEEEDEARGGEGFSAAAGVAVAEVRKGGDDAPTSTTIASGSPGTPETPPEAGLLSARSSDCELEDGGEASPKGEALPEPEPEPEPATAMEAPGSQREDLLQQAREHIDNGNHTYHVSQVAAMW